MMVFGVAPQCEERGAIPTPANFEIADPPSGTGLELHWPIVIALIVVATPFCCLYVERLRSCSGYIILRDRPGNMGLVTRS